MSPYVEWDISSAPEQFWPDVYPDITIHTDVSGTGTQVCRLKVQCLNHWAMTMPSPCFALEWWGSWILADKVQCWLLSQQGREHRDLDIIIFKEVLENLARVERVLTMPGGSLLLAGRSGVGRRTAVLLVAHMHHMELISPKITRGYGIKQFKNELKTVAVRAAIISIAVHIALTLLVEWQEGHPACKKT